jgi:hypothetical protein
MARVIGSASRLASVSSRSFMAGIFRKRVEIDSRPRQI